MREEENRKKLEEEIKKLKEQDKFLMQDKDEDEEDKDLPDIAETYYKDWYYSQCWRKNEEKNWFFEESH